MNQLKIILFFMSGILLYFIYSQILLFKESKLNSLSRSNDNIDNLCMKSNLNIFEQNEVNILFKKQVLFPAFIDSIIRKFNLLFENMTYLDYLQFSRKYKVDSCKTKNIYKFVTLIMLHKLFTCKSAANGSVGEIWKIPYFWHYVKPNPRYKIKLISNGINLSDIKPPKEFSRYHTYADIDRTPYLYWSDFLSESSKYESTNHGKFYSFGWCSEREMAFVSLMKILNFNANVVTRGNHSITEVFTYFTGLENQSKLFKVIIDNTFDRVEWVEIESDIGIKSNPTDWYNFKAKSNSELSKLKKLSITSLRANEAISQIENYLKIYYNLTIQ